MFYEKHSAAARQTRQMLHSYLLSKHLCHCFVTALALLAPVLRAASVHTLN